MRVYLKTTAPRAKHTKMVTPARTSDSADFRDSRGAPVTYQVHFVDGRAEVPSNLGRWMIDEGYATSLILPARKVVDLFRRRAHG